MLTKIALLSLLATLAGDPVTKDEKGADTAPNTDRSRGFMLVYERGYCGALGQDLGKDIHDPDECFRLAQEFRATAFIQYGPKIQEGEVLGRATEVHLQPVRAVAGECPPLALHTCMEPSGRDPDARVA